MKLIAFTKMLPARDIGGLVRLAQRTGLEGFDLCVREGYPVHPGNAETELPVVVRQLAEAGISVPMVTGEGLWHAATEAASQRILAGMAQAGVGLYKLGYFFYRPDRDGDYWQHVDAARRELEAWASLAAREGVKVCYHTHCDVPGLSLGYHVGTNCAELMHLLRGFDPTQVGAYIGTGNLVVSGEPFEYGLAMLSDYLAVVELQDMHLERVQAGDEGAHRRHWTPAGQGAVPWSSVFESLIRRGFDGPLTMHAEFEVGQGQSFEELLVREVSYFKQKREQALAAQRCIADPAPANC